MYNASKNGKIVQSKMFIFAFETKIGHDVFKLDFFSDFRASNIPIPKHIEWIMENFVGN